VTGELRVYLGAAPGVGKTYAMLHEGHRRSDRGTDVVIGFVETHGRRETQRLVTGLELVPRRILRHRAVDFTEMDVDAIVARAPGVVLVDELAHTNVPGSRHEKRWQDVEELLAAGIDVITTVNIQHLESLNDVVVAITGVRQQETVPDGVVRRADQIELIDMSPQALRKRLAHGNVYPPEKVDAALANYFRVGNLTALRELALLWVADRVDDALEGYRAEHDIDVPWPARERVVVALTGGPEGEALIRRGVRIAQRASGGELLALHVSRSDGLTGAGPDMLARLRALVEQLGGTFHSVVGNDVAQAVLDFARGVNASQIVIGASRRGRLAALLTLGVGAEVVRNSGDIDVHIVTHPHATYRFRRISRNTSLPVGRLIAGWLLAVLAPPALTVGLTGVRADVGLPAELMLYLALTVVVSLVGGLWPALISALACGVLANYFFTPPLHTLTVSEPENVLAICVLIAVAAAVSTVVDLSARRTLQAARARAEADTLAQLAGSVLRGADAMQALLDRVRETFGLTGVALLERSRQGAGHVAGWTRLAASPPGRWVIGPEISGASEISDVFDTSDTIIPVSEGRVLALHGRRLPAEQLRVATAIATQLEAVLERDRLRAEAARSRREHERTAIRTALLAAVSHDLRSPLAAVLAGVGSLRADDVVLSETDRGELLETIEHSANRLQSLIDNLLDMSRLDSGVVSPVLAPVSLDELVARAMSGIEPGRVRVDVPDTLPMINVDAGLLERSLANVVENALRHSASSQEVLVSAGQVAGAVVVRVIDRGQGVPDSQKEAIFMAFQRLGDTPEGHGVGLGLAVARGFAEANGGTLEAEDTPGGGLTMVLRLPLPAASSPPSLSSPSSSSSSSPSSLPSSSSSS
jgi:two-component system sensor histidine kinase KdpD